MLNFFRKKSITLVALHKIGGFQLPLVLGIALLAMYSSSVLFESALSTQQISTFEKETYEVDLIAARALADAEKALMLTSTTPDLQSNVGAITINRTTNSVQNVWHPVISDRKLTAAKDPIRNNRDIEWYYQGDEWWKDNSNTTNDPGGYYTIEYSSLNVTGMDVVEDVYRGSGKRLLYTITAFATGPRQANAHRQTTVARVFYSSSLPPPPPRGPT